MGRLPGALKSYRDRLEIREKLVKQDPSNANWHGELGRVYWRTGSTWTKAESEPNKEARAMMEKGRDLLRQLKEHIGLTANQQEWLDSIEADLRRTEEKK